MSTEESSESSESSEQAKRRRILDAAFNICETRGVHAARMEEVAALAQVSKGTLYRFFESKEDLILATILDSYAAATRQTGAGSAEEETQPGPAERLRHRLEGLSKALGAVAPRSRVHYQAFGVVADSPTADQKLTDFLARFHRDRQAEYEQFIREGQKEGVFRADVDATVVAQAIGSMMSGFIYRAAFDPAGATPEGLLACFDTLLRDVLGYSEQARPDEAGPDG